MCYQPYQSQSTVTRGTLLTTPLQAESGLPPSHSPEKMYPLEAWLIKQNAVPSQLVTKQSWSSALLKGTSVMTEDRAHTLLLTRMELGFGDLACSAMTRHNGVNIGSHFPVNQH